MTTATAPWMELGGDGKMHEVKDPAKIRQLRRND